MSKRKSRAKSMFLDKTDIEFPDDSDPDMDIFAKPKVQVATISKESKATGSRISARGKKEKKIYDPSENNGPVLKKKKDEVSSAKKLTLTPSKTASPVKSTPLSPNMNFPTAKSPHKLTVQSAKRKLDLDKDIAEIQLEKIQKLSVVKSVSTSEVNKRTQSRKEKPREIQPAIVVPEVVHNPPEKPLKSIMRRSHSITSDTTATTIAIPSDLTPLEIGKWSPEEVSEYFIRQKFDYKDAMKFKEQEIDGEALLILQRDDLKNLNWKVGIFVKMWIQVLRLQAGKLTPLILINFNINYKNFKAKMIQHNRGSELNTAAVVHINKKKETI